MLDVLKTVPFDVAVEAAYRLSLILRSRGRFTPETSLGEAADRLLLKRGTAELTRVVDELFAEVERVEGRHFSEIPQPAVERYLVRLNQILTQRIRERPGYDPERGRALLNELRRDYGPPYRHQHAA